MTDNTNPTSSWFRPFGRSNNSNPKRQQHQQQEQRQSPPLQTRQPSPHASTHISTSTEPLTGESPPRGIGHHFHHNQNQQHHQAHPRKPASATLRTVSSFLNFKSSTNKTGCGTGKNHVWQLSSKSESGGAAAAKSEYDPMIRTPASLAMLPLAEVDYGPSSCVDGRYDTGVGTRSRSESGSGAGWKNGDGEEGGERTWHNPNVMQTTEMLSSVMARMTPGDRLDPTYVSFPPPPFFFIVPASEKDRVGPLTSRAAITRAFSPLLKAFIGLHGDCKRPRNSSLR